MDCSTNATPSLECKGGENLSTAISGVLTRAYSSREVLDPISLALHAGYTCWILYVDTLVIEVGGKHLKIKERTKKRRRMKI